MFSSSPEAFQILVCYALGGRRRSCKVAQGEGSRGRYSSPYGRFDRQSASPGSVVSCRGCQDLDRPCRCSCQSRTSIERSIRLAGWARVAGSERQFSVDTPARRVEIGSLDRAAAVYDFDGGLPAETDDALDLASYMESPSPGAAITGGWAAIEALLTHPGEGKHHEAADRLAALVTCSFPRAEMTPLAYRHSEGSDPLAAEIRNASANKQKVLLVERHLSQGGRLTLTNGSDIAAEMRMINLINDRAPSLARIRLYVTESLRRLYNQRNIIAHSGSLRSVTLEATLRTSLPLVGAGLDRIVHAQLESEGDLRPLALVARAETELRMAGSPGERDLASLLD